VSDLQDNMKITYGAILPVPIEEAFAFVSAPETWPQYFSAMQSLQSLSGWGAVGGKARIVGKFMGQTQLSELELVDWEAPVRFRYLMRTESRPTLDNLRVFSEMPEGTRLTGTTEADPRPGIRGIYDRLAARILQRLYDRAMLRLTEVIRQPRRTA
jgi:uncharacterized protein YndB with AHSA1/START domain